MLLVVNLCFLAVFSVSPAVGQQQCEPGWVNNGLSCYLLTDVHGSDKDGPDRLTGQLSCLSKDAYLVEIDSQEENDFIKAWLRSDLDNTTYGVWLDAADRTGEGNWVWMNSFDSLTFTDWADHRGAQYGNCLIISPDYSYHWVPEDCDKTGNMTYICEYQLCNASVACSDQGSCYSLSCDSYMPRENPDYEDDPNPELYSCPQGSLVRIETEEESQFIKDFLSQTQDDVQYVWSAGFDENGAWNWQDIAQPISGFSDWADTDVEKYHDEGCIALSREKGWSWVDHPCNNQYRVLCEFPKPSE